MKILAVLHKTCLWPTIFIAFFAIFLAFFWCEASLNQALISFQRFASSKNIEIKNYKMDSLPLSIQIETIVIPFMDSGVLFRDTDARLELFPPCLRISSHVLGGRLELLAYFSLAFPPLIKNVKFSLDNAKLNDLPENLKNNVFVQILGGRINAKGEAELNLKIRHPDWQKIQGKLNVNLEQASLKLLVPVLKNERLENISGKSDLIFKGTNIVLDFCQLSSLPLSFKARGDMQNWLLGQNCRLNLKTELHIPESTINSALVPARTREQILQKGFVRAKLGGTLSHPEIYLEN